MSIKDYSTGEYPSPDEPTWTTETLTRDYSVVGFMAPYVIVKRKSDGVTGTLQFNHSPRVYWNWEPAKEER